MRNANVTFCHSKRKHIILVLKIKDVTKYHSADHSLSHIHLHTSKYCHYNDMAKHLTITLCHLIIVIFTYFLSRHRSRSKPMGSRLPSWETFIIVASIIYIADNLKLVNCVYKWSTCNTSMQLRTCNSYLYKNSKLWKKGAAPKFQGEKDVKSKVAAKKAKNGCGNSKST